MRNTLGRRLERDAERLGLSEGNAVERWDPLWAPQLIILGAIALDLALTDKVTVGPSWLLPALESVAVVALIASSPTPGVHRHPLRRRFVIGVIALVSATNIFSLVELCVLLVEGGKTAPADGRALIGSGMVLWITNVLLFGVWFWLLDRGGPVARASDAPAMPDFLFVQMSEPTYAPKGWKPTIVDYLYTSFTNATAFSPTDTMPLTPTAKSLMAIQSLTALVTIGLVVARAVNILQT